MTRNKIPIDAFARNPRDRPIRSAYLAHIEIDGVYFARYRNGIEELNGKLAGGTSEVRPVRSVPGDDLVERFERFQTGRIRVDSRCQDRPYAIGEANKRNILSCRPDLGVVGFQVFKRGKRDDEITDRPWPDEQSFQLRISSGNLSSIVSGRRQTRSSHA